MITPWLLKRLVCLLAVISIRVHAAPINIREAVEVGGIKQWITIKGADDQAPVLLFLHGGPGNSVMGYDQKFTADLQKHFVVVQWDQRGSGKTKTLNNSDMPLSVDLMVNDAVEMIRLLEGRFLQDRIWLMGHSWGGFLALMVAARSPELLKGCFAISPMIDQARSEQITLGWMMEKAREQNNVLAQKELTGVKVPFENVEQLYFDRKWIALYSGKNPPAKSFVLSWGRTWFAVFSEASHINLFEEAPEIRCPVYFFIGGQDRQTHFKVAEEYYNALKAEKKDLFWFTDSGHNLNLTEPAKLQKIVITVLMSKN